jgi:hypothetical protein
MGILLFTWIAVHARFLGTEWAMSAIRDLYRSGFRHKTVFSMAERRVVTLRATLLA